MKKVILVISAFCTFSFVCAQAKLPVIKKPAIKENKINPKFLTKSDPKASLAFALTNQQGLIADVTITCTVKNGSTNKFSFSDTTGIANVVLYEKYAGSARRRVPGRSRPFRNLASGEEIKFTYVVEKWSNATEFPPTYQLVITYSSPKNVTNNDGNLYNNTVTLNGLEINRVIGESAH